MRRPALILGMDRSGEDNRRVRKHPARQLFIIPDEGFLRLAAEPSHRVRARYSDWHSGIVLDQALCWQPLR